MTTTTSATVIIILTMLAAATTSAFDAVGASLVGRRPRRPFERVSPGDGCAGRRRRPTTQTSSSSSLSFALPPPPEEAASSILFLLSNPQHHQQQQEQLLLLPSASAIMTYLALVFHHDRPRGRLDVDPSHLVVSPSRVPNGGLGLYANAHMSCGTVLGTYPGVLRSSSAFHDVKCRAFPRAIYYSWAFGDGSDRVIDPTDECGALGEICLGGSPADEISTLMHSTLFRYFGTSTILCRINEPPIGVGGCSVSAREDGDKGEVVFVLIRDVEPGMELYMDYGLNYDRSGYGPASS